jgi:hypothetical protein
MMFKSTKELLESGNNFVVLDGVPCFIMATLKDKLILETRSGLKSIKLDEVKEVAKIGGKMY